MSPHKGHLMIMKEGSTGPGRIPKMLPSRELRKSGICSERASFTVFTDQSISISDRRKYHVRAWSVGLEMMMMMMMTTLSLSVHIYEWVFNNSSCLASESPFLHLNHAYEVSRPLSRVPAAWQNRNKKWVDAKRHRHDEIVYCLNNYVKVFVHQVSAKWKKIEIWNCAQERSEASARV